MKMPHFHAHHRQRGLSLIEVLVGLTIGLLIVGIALGGVQISRQLASTTSEAARLQQQATFALRVIGAQVRQAGALQLNLAFNQTPPAGILSLEIDPADPVAFDTSFDRKTQALDSSSAEPLQVGYAQYEERLRDPASPTDTMAKSQLRDCLGNEPGSTIVGSGFYLKKADSTDLTGPLLCLGSSNNTPQPIIADVADFQVVWLRQQVVNGVPQLQRVNATTAEEDWSQIYGVEVCIEMAGSEVIDTGTSTYRPCSWTSGPGSARGNRLRMVYRSTFQTRSQGNL